MKIYTEINYEWLDGQLVKTSSKSFEYSGNISECKSSGGEIVADLGQVGTQVTQATTDFVDQNTDSIANSSEIQQLGQNINPIVNPLAIIPMISNAMGLGDGLPGVEGAIPASSGPGDPSYAKGVGGKKEKNNPFLSIQKGKKFARASSQFRRPTNTIS